ncbi:MAG TPA: DUF6529 family protein [Thermoleophilaceae bacterium]
MTSTRSARSTSTRSCAETARTENRRLLTALLAGAAVSLTLGVYGHVHDPSQKLVFTLFFSQTISMKVWFASVALFFAILQVFGALWLYGKIGPPAPSWLGSAHRISGRLAFLFSLPVAYHCLWSLGFQSTDTRVLLHSIFGCLVYGAFAAKVLIVRTPRAPGWALPVAGGLTFTTLVVVWLTSALWFIDKNGFPAL